jgi:hypothetical protein
MSLTSLGVPWQVKGSSRPWLVKTLAILMLILLAGLYRPAHAAAGSALPAQRPFKEIMGLGVKFSQGQPLRQLGMLDELGVHWVRDTVMWSEMEPTSGKYSELPRAFQTRLDYYKEHDIGVVFMLAYGNDRAYPATPDKPFAPIDPDALGRYAVHIAKALKQSGVRFVLEVWNEPHNFVVRPMVGGAWNAKPPSPWVQHYVNMVNQVVKQVKAADPSVQVIDCDDMWVLHYWFIEQGLNKELDGFGVHPYSGPNSIGPEVAAVYHDTDWTKPFHVVDADRSFRSAVQRLRDKGTAAQARTPDIWITEWGWAVGERSPHGPLSERQVAAYLPRAYIAAAAAGVKVLCWFSSQDSVDGPMGLLANDGSERPSFDAYLTMSRQLGALTLDRQLLGAKSTTQGVQAYLFKGQAEHSKLVIWAMDDTNHALKLPNSWKVSSTVNFLGEKIKPTELNGQSVWKITTEPLYLTIAGEAHDNWADDFAQ